MSVVYVERYKVVDQEYGIEDHKDGRPDRDHFFHDDFLKGERKRFQVWRSGCGIGGFDTRIVAQATLLDYAKRDMRDRVDQAVSVITVCNGALVRLEEGMSSFAIGRHS